MFGGSLGTTLRPHAALRFKETTAASTDSPMPQKIDESSAHINRDTLVITEGRSLVNKVNKIGLKTDPCGIPVATGKPVRFDSNKNSELHSTTKLALDPI